MTSPPPRPRTALPLLGAAIVLAGCTSSTPGPKADPALCGQRVVGVAASFGDVDIDALNPGPGVIVPIKKVAQIRARSASGCTATLTYTITDSRPISALSLTARIGSTTVPGTPVLAGHHSGVEQWPGRFALPLPAKASSATIIVDVSRYQETGKAPVVPTADRRSVTLYLSPVAGGAFPASGS